TPPALVIAFSRPQRPILFQYSFINALNDRGNSMCDACVIDTVKNRMLSRRSFFRAAAAGAATITAAGSGVLSPALAQAPTTATDLTHELYEEFPTFFGQQQFWREQKFNYKEHKFNLFELRVNEHTGTHLDAPLHFS